MNFGELWEMSKFQLFLRSGAVGIFLSKIETFPNCFKFHMHFPGSDSNKFFKVREFWRTLRKCQNFILFLRSGALSAFFCQKLKLLQTASNCTCMLLEVIPINSVSFMNFGELWEMSKFQFFLRSGAVGIFLSKIETFPNCFKFHMHFPGSDSNKFFKFREFWRTLRKCQNFILFLRSGAVSIFLSKIETSPNCFKFHMHFPGSDSNKFCKFREFWRTLRKCQKFILFLRSGAVSFFLSKIETSPNCFKFHIHVPGGDSNKFCKCHEFRRTLRNVKISSFF